MRLSPFALAFLATALPLSAQGIFIQVPAFSCATAAGSNAFPVLSWSFGVSLSSTGTPNFSSLSIKKNFDECSGAFFRSSAAGQPIAAVTITQTDKNRAPQTIVQLTNATVTADTSGGSTGGSPIQELSFSYETICIANAANNTKSCYDLTAANAKLRPQGRR